MQHRHSEADCVNCDGLDAVKTSVIAAIRGPDSAEDSHAENLPGGAVDGVKVEVAVDSDGAGALLELALELEALLLLLLLELLDLGCSSSDENSDSSQTLITCKQT